MEYRYELEDTTFGEHVHEKPRSHHEAKMVSRTTNTSLPDGEPDKCFSSLPIAILPFLHYRPQNPRPNPTTKAHTIHQSPIHQKSTLTSNHHNLILQSQP